MSDRELELLPHQADLLEDTDSEILVLKGGLRAGKTFGAVCKALDLAERNWPTPILVVEPTYQMVRDVFLETARRIFDDNGIPYDFHRTDHVMTVWPDSDRPLRLFLRSLDRPERMIGFTAGAALVDEWESCTEEGIIRVRERITAGARGVTCPQLVLIGTPEGFGFGYRWTEEDPLEGLRMITARTLDNVHVSESYVAGVSRMLSEGEARERLEGIRTAKTGVVYSRFSRALHCRPDDGRGRLEVWADFNVDPMAWAIVRVTDREAHVVRELVGRHTDTLAHAELTRRVLAEMLHTTEDGVRREGITVICDASGASRSSNSTQSDVAILQRAGFRVKHPAVNPFILDRVASVNLLLAEGRLSVDPAKAPYIARCLEQQPWGSDGMPDKSPKLGLDHGCLVAGTMVTTSAGNVPIESVRVGDMVLTRSGYRQVEWSGMTDEDAEIVTAAGITGTPDHPVWTENRGWVRLDLLMQSDTILTCESNQSSSTESSSGDTLNPGTYRCGSISRPEEHTGSAESEGCIRRSGSRPMGQSPRGTIFTTSTETPATTTSPTLSASMQIRTPTGTVMIRSIPAALRRSTKIDTSPPNGTEATPDASGTPILPGGTSASACTGLSACAAGSNQPRTASSSRCSAQGNARQSTGETPGSTMSTGSANAERSSPSIGTSKPGTALDLVPARPAGRAAVYNLKVSGDPEYFANGVLVHNCDLVGYGVHFHWPATAPRGNQAPPQQRGRRRLALV